MTYSVGHINNTFIVICEFVHDVKESLIEEYCWECFLKGNVNKLLHYNKNNQYIIKGAKTSYDNIRLFYIR